MNIQTLEQFKKSKRYLIVMQRAANQLPAILPQVQDIMASVAQTGDQALRRFTKKFDNVILQELRVTPQEIKQAYQKVSPAVLQALEMAAENIRSTHKAHLPTKLATAVPQPGITVQRIWQPIQNIGIYIPGGKAVYPSSVLMTAIPAQLAGCRKVAITTPPQADGSIHPAILVAADKAGVANIYKVGGAQAIAALVYGTVSIPQVSKIFGPGNAYVAAAKLLAYQSGKVAIDSPAGPSEVLVIADQSANPEFVAADLLCDAEHDESAAAVLVTTSRILAQRVIRVMQQQLTQLATATRIKKALQTYGACIVVKNIEQAVEFANQYAAEHTLIQTQQPKQIAQLITESSSVFIGNYSCKSAGDYATGANHVLPTGGAARMFSGLSVYDFMRLVEYQTVTKSGLRGIRSTIETLSTVEQLPAHTQSCAIRFKSKL